jgi:hypothetical protein
MGRPQAGGWTWGLQFLNVILACDKVLRRIRTWADSMERPKKLICAKYR